MEPWAIFITAAGGATVGSICGIVIGCMLMYFVLAILKW